MIEVKNLHKGFNGQKILKGVNLKIEEGQTLALIGSSGKGKTVLLKHLIGLMVPDEGEVLIDQQNIHRLRGKALKNLKNQFGVVFQFGALFDSLTIFDNVAFPLVEKTKFNEAQIREKVFEELRSVNLEHDADKYPAQISGGMRKRVALARGLILDPKIIFFDEPTTGLDPVIAQSIYKLIRNLQEERDITALIVSHEIPGIFKVVNRVAMLHNGVIIASGTPEDIQTNTNPVIQKFLSGEVE